MIISFEQTETFGDYYYLYLIDLKKAKYYIRSRVHIRVVILRDNLDTKTKDFLDDNAMNIQYPLQPPPLYVFHFYLKMQKSEEFI